MIYNTGGMSYHMRDMDEDMQLAIELLTHIVSLWLTIRGFSISKSWKSTVKIMNTSELSVGDMYSHN